MPDQTWQKTKYTSRHQWNSASLRRAYSYGGSPYSQLDIPNPLNRKRHATTESEDLYQHLAKRRTVSTPQIPISNEEEEPVNAQAYTQTTLKKKIKRTPKLAKNLEHFKTTFESVAAAKHSLISPHILTIPTRSLKFCRYLRR